jgi:putative transposase
LEVKKRYTEEQIIGFLKEADSGVPLKELCRRHGFSEASYYLWRSKFGGMEVSDAKRLKALEAENARLKKLLADALCTRRGRPPEATNGDGSRTAVVRSRGTWLRTCSSVRISVAVSRSRSPVGSSHTRIEGSVTIALAMATLCCSPPDNSEGLYCARSLNPTICKAEYTRALRSARDKRISLRGNSVFAAALNAGIRL